MIESNRRYFLGSWVACLDTPAFRCQVVTSPEMLVSQWTTCVFVTTQDGKRTLVARLVHSKVLSKKQHRDLHDTIATSLDFLGDRLQRFGDSVAAIFAQALEFGIVTKMAKGKDTEIDEDGVIQALSILRKEL